MASIADAHGGAVVEWASAGIALGELSGGKESGDLHVIAPFPDGVLVAAIDGLGHGPEAALAARVAAHVLEASAGEPVVALVERCHTALRRTRGVVMSLASFNAREASMTWIGVGNVEGVLLRADRAAERPRETFALRGGVVGDQLPPLRSSVLPVSPGDTLVMVTDGIRRRFTDGLALGASLQEIADSIMNDHRKGSDDALVVVARYVGGTR